MVPVKPVDPRMILEPYERRYSNDLVAYIVNVAYQDDGSHHRGLYFPEWRTVFFIHSNQLCARHQIYNDTSSKKVTISAVDSKVFVSAYYSFQHYCEKMESAKGVFKGYLETLDSKI